MFRAIALLVLFLAAPAHAAPWYLDRSQTRVEVDVAWLGQVVKVKFKDISGAVDFNPDRPTNTKAKINVAAGTANTGIGIANGLVRGREYLNAKAHPHITFDLKKLKITGASTANVTGSITLLGQTRPATFAARLTRLGPAKDDASRTEAGFFLTGQIDRAAFGNTTGIPAVAQVLPVRIWLMMHSKPVS